MIRNKYKLRAKKEKDFKLWAKAVNIIYINNVGNTAIKGVKGFTKKEWNRHDIVTLMNIREQMLEIKAYRTNNFLYGKESLINFNTQKDA